MSIRITQGMLYSRALIDVQNGLSKFSRLQQEVATGRRINRPSDDPAAALRILPLRNDLRDLEQLGSNVSLARETLNTGAASLEDGSSLMQRVRELTTQAANGTLSAGDRDSIGSEIDQLLNQLVGIGNSRRGDKYLFGGTANGTAPFEVVTDGGGTRVVYRGNRENLDVEVAPGVRTALNVPGDDIFQQRDRGATTFTAAVGSSTTGALPTGAGDTGVGFGSLSVTFGGLGSGVPSTITAGTGASTAVGPLAFEFTTAPDTLGIAGGTKLPIPVTNGTFTTADGRTISLTVSGVPAALTGTFNANANLSLDGGETVVTVSDFSSSSVQVRNSYDDTVLNVDVRTMARTGTEDVKFEGTFDAFTTLVTLRNLLRNEETLPDNVVRDRIAQMLTEVDSAHDAILDGVRELGFRSSSMDILSNRVEGLRVARTESLSLVQDTDIAEAILDLQRQDLSYQAALQVTSRVIQTSLSSLLG
jgi:flagellar hook-associated protein 3 FlgL